MGGLADRTAGRGMDRLTRAAPSGLSPGPRAAPMSAGTQAGGLRVAATFPRWRFATGCSELHPCSSWPCSFSDRSPPPVPILQPPSIVLWSRFQRPPHRERSCLPAVRIHRRAPHVALRHPGPRHQPAQWPQRRRDDHRSRTVRARPRPRLVGGCRAGARRDRIGRGAGPYGAAVRGGAAQGAIVTGSPGRMR